MSRGWSLTWNDKALLKSVNSVAAKVAEEGAERVAEDAKRILMSNAKEPTGKLASEIHVVRSKYKNGGWLVIAQPKGHYTDYYAPHVELGTSRTRAVPFLRPALKKNKRWIFKRYKEEIEGK